MQASDKSLAIFFGSQTGTGEEFAFRLSQNARKYGIKSLVLNPEDVDFEELENLKDSNIKNPFIIMCLATYGEGDPTDNMTEMYEWITSDERETDMLEGVNFAVFGLGNKTYEHYNAIGKNMDKLLEKLGGERIYELGLGDDNENIDEHFITWQEPLWEKVVEKFDIDVTSGTLECQNIYKMNPIEHDDV